MSNFISKINPLDKKHWKAKAKSFKKTWKWVALAVAVYFTAGLALSAMPATASFAAAMPGFAGGGAMGLGVGAGATAGTGVFSQAAAAMGMGTLGSAGGLVGGATAAGTSSTALAGAGFSSGAIAAGTTEAGSAGLLSGTAAGSVAGGAAIGSAPGGVMSAGGLVGSGAPAAVQAVVTPTALTANSGMALSTKLMLAASGVQAVSALVAPKEDQIAAAQKKWRGAFYGMDANGAAAPAPGAAPSAQPKTSTNPAAQIAPTAQQRTLLDPSKSYATSAARPMDRAPMQSAFGAQGTGAAPPPLVPKPQAPIRTLLPPEDAQGYRFGVA